MVTPASEQNAINTHVKGILDMPVVIESHYPTVTLKIFALTKTGPRAIQQKELDWFSLRLNLINDTRASSVLLGFMWGKNRLQQFQTLIWVHRQSTH